MARMSASVENAVTRFADRAQKLLDRSQHRCARSRVEREAVERLRREVDNRRGLIELRPVGRSYEEALDGAPNAWVTTTSIDGELASTLRIHVSCHERDRLPSLDVFPEVIRPRLRIGRTIVDLTRLAARLEPARRFPELPYLALRPGWLAAEYFDADFVVVTTSQDLQPFYHRVFGYEPWGGPRELPYGARGMCCMGLDFRAAKDRVLTAYPLFRSSHTERGALFRRGTELRLVASADADTPLVTHDGRRARSAAWRR